MYYNPTDSSLTRQAWATQQRIIDEMGEGLGQDSDLVNKAVDAAASRLGDLGADKNYVKTCAVGFVAAGFAGYVAGRVGVLPTAVGVGIAYAVLKSMER